MGRNLALWVDTNSGVKTKVINLGMKFGLEEMYERVNTDVVDMVRLPNNIDVWVDDNGLITPDNIVIEYTFHINDDDVTHSIQLAGNALFLTHDKNGESVGLSKKQFNWLKDNMSITPIGVTK